MEDCQFPTKKEPSIQIESQNNVAELLLILEEMFIMNLYQLDSQPSLLLESIGKAAWKI